jgi:hypothetical protein
MKKPISRRASNKAVDRALCASYSYHAEVTYPAASEDQIQRELDDITMRAARMKPDISRPLPSPRSLTPARKRSGTKSGRVVFRVAKVLTVVAVAAIIWAIVTLMLTSAPGHATLGEHALRIAPTLLIWLVGILIWAVMQVAAVATTLAFSSSAKLLRRRLSERRSALVGRGSKTPSRESDAADAAGRGSG